MYTDVTKGIMEKVNPGQKIPANNVPQKSNEMVQKPAEAAPHVIGG